MLADFATGFSLSLAIEPAVVGTVNGRFATKSPTEFVAKLASVYGFVWYTHAGTLFVSRASDVVTKGISAPGGNVASMRKALADLGVLEPRFGWGELADHGMAIVSGPPSYIQLVETTIRNLPARAQQIKVFRLRHASAQDRTVPYRGQELNIPGLASILRGMVGGAAVSLISTASDKPADAKYKQYNWKVVEELKMPGAGNLFVKTHPKSKNLWADLPMNPERENAESVYVYSLADLSKAPVINPHPTSGTNVDATTQGSEQVPTGFTAASHQASIWYEWTPDFSGWYEINTTGSSVDTVLSVWTGSGIGSLTLVHVNDDANGGPTSRIWLNASGSTYYICIAGKSGQPRGNTLLAVFGIPDPLVTSVSAISFSPAPVNVTSAAATLTCDVTMQANATPDLGYFRLYDPFGSSFTEASFSVANRTSGNNSSGVYRVTLSIPAHAQPGSYRWALRVQNTSGSKVGSFGWEELSRASLAIPTVQNTGAVDTYLHWQKLYQLSGTGSGQTEDFDGDGITNLEEFTFGSNPKVGGRALVATSGGTITSAGSMPGSMSMV